MSDGRIPIAKILYTVSQQTHLSCRPLSHALRELTSIIIISFNVYCILFFTILHPLVIDWLTIVVGFGTFLFSAIGLVAMYRVSCKFFQDFEWKRRYQQMNSLFNILFYFFSFPKTKEDPKLLKPFLIWKFLQIFFEAYWVVLLMFSVPFIFRVPFGIILVGKSWKLHAVVSTTRLIRDQKRREERKLSRSKAKPHAYQQLKVVIPHRFSFPPC